MSNKTLSLRDFRYSRGIQRKFAMMHLGISGKHFNDIEVGRVNLTEKVATKLSVFYNLSIDEIKKMYEVSKNEK